MKSFSSRKTMELFTNVAGRHLKEDSLAGTNHWMEYTPLIHQFELERLKNDFSVLARHIVLIEDSTTLQAC